MTSVVPCYGCKRRAHYRWSTRGINRNVNHVPLCHACCMAWLGNAETDPSLGPSKVVELVYVAELTSVERLAVAERAEQVAGVVVVSTVSSRLAEPLAALKAKRGRADG